MKRTYAVVIAIIVVLAGVTQAENPPTTQQSAQTIEVKISLSYLQYLPPGYESDPTNAKDGEGKGWPLVLFLHGAGERGDNLELVKTHGPPKLVAQGKQFPFILISPQCPKDDWWDAQVLEKLLDEMVRKFKVDPDRIYVTGMSMGGFGTWDLARRQPTRFAAIAPVCGGSDADLAWIFPGLKSLPVWAFHGDKDKIVPLKRSQDMINAVTTLGNNEVRLTVYPGVGHNSWEKAYDDPELYTWLLSHKRIAQTSQPAPVH